MTRHRFFATTARGLEPILLAELKTLNPHSVKQSHGGVFFEGPLEIAYRANLWLRTAQRVLWPLAEVSCGDYDALYAGAGTIDWSDHLTNGRTLAIEAACFNSPLTHSHHAALRIKDAIVDQLRTRTGTRPDVDVKDPDVRIHAYIHQETCQLSIDLSGDPLFMRRYRMAQGGAPLKETLAAAVLMFSGWKPRPARAATADSPRELRWPLLCDPLCGSGTLAIEAALMARDRAPGRLRGFGFQRHPSYGDAEVKLFKQLCEEADARALPASTVRILASDRDPEVLEAARLNARAARVEDSIEFELRDVRDLEPLPPGSFIVSNPPYGKRLGGSNESVESLYRVMGHQFKRHKGELWLLSAAPGFEYSLGLPAKERHRLYNGPIETWLYGYHLGSTPPTARRR